MKFKAVVAVEGDEEVVSKLFEAESKDFKHKRSSYDMSLKKGVVEFNIVADDATALRSTLDSVAKMLKVYGDMKDVK